jgi:iron complex transport system ATP-binding protein
VSLFELQDVSHFYRGVPRAALAGVTIDVERGSLLALLGPNGSGKSTLLRVMLGELEASSGSVLYAGRPSNERSRREIAREIAFVPQAEPMAFPMTVRKLVEMGRYPHTGILGRMGSADREAVDLAMERAGVADLGGRSMGNLSGGERQRVRIARALAQQPKILVLDEPTAALDLHFAMETFELMSELTEEGSFTVVVATHNLNLAARYATQLLLLCSGCIEASGLPSEVITAENIRRVYRWPVVVTSSDDLGPRKGAPQVTPLSPSAGHKTS